MNWTPSLRRPFQELGWLLADNQVSENDPCVLIAHLACPRPGFTDTGKTILGIVPSFAERYLSTVLFEGI